MNAGTIRELNSAAHGFTGDFSDGVNTKAMKESLGSKGGAAIALQLFDTTLLCMSSHLAKEWHTTIGKRAQYGELAAMVGAKLVEGPDGRPACPEFQWHSLFHHVIWLGDFNYHVDQEQIGPDETLAAIANPDGLPWSRLGQYDELKREIDSGSCW